MIVVETLKHRNITLTLKMPELGLLSAIALATTIRLSAALKRHPLGAYDVGNALASGEEIGIREDHLSNRTRDVFLRLPEKHLPRMLPDPTVSRHFHLA